MIHSVSISSLGGVLANAVTDAPEAVLEGSMRLVEENPIPEPVDGGRNQALQTLDLSENQLRVPPDVSRNQALQTLDLSENQLRVPPDVSRDQALDSPIHGMLRI